MVRLKSYWNYTSWRYNKMDSVSLEKEKNENKNSFIWQINKT